MAMRQDESTNGMRSAGVMERFDHNSQIKFASVHSYGVHGYKNHHVYNGTNLLQRKCLITSPTYFPGYSFLTSLPYQRSS